MGMFLNFVFFTAVGVELGWACCSLCGQTDAVDIGCAGCHLHAFPLPFHTKTKGNAVIFWKFCIAHCSLC